MLRWTCHPHVIPAPNHVIPTLQPCHPERSAAKSRDLPHLVRGWAVPGFLHSAFAPVGMTRGGCASVDMSPTCHPNPPNVSSQPPTMSSQPPTMSSQPPTMSSRAQRSEAEGSFAPGSRLGSARIPPLRFRSGRNDTGRVCSGGHVTHMSSQPSSRVIPAPNLVIPSAAKRSRGIFRTWFEAGQYQDSSTPLSLRSE